jgi:hypothetical protein
VTQFKGRQFSGRLFAGRLFRGPETEAPPAMLPGAGGRRQRTPARQPVQRRDRDDDVLLFLLR